MEYVFEIEQQCDTLENRAHAAELRYRDAMKNLQEIQLEDTKVASHGQSEEENTKIPVDHHSDEKERENLVSHILNGKVYLFYNADGSNKMEYL
jgi:WNK lysine deficient protein kinase